MILFCARAHMVSVSEVSEAFREASEELDNQENEEGNARATGHSSPLRTLN